MSPNIPRYLEFHITRLGGDAYAVTIPDLGVDTFLFGGVPEWQLDDLICNKIYEKFGCGPDSYTTFWED